MYFIAMKQIDGKATRRPKYDRLFFWYVPLVSIILTLILLNATGWDWRLLAFMIPGIGIGGVLGVLLRDAPG